MLVGVDDFLDDVGRSARMMTDPADPDKAAFVSRAPHPRGAVLTVLDASDRYAAGRRLKASHALADRTRRRFELVLDTAVAFGGARSEDEVADLLAHTVATAYRAEESVVFLIGEDGRFRRAAGSNPFADFAELSSLGDEALRLRRVVTISGAEEASTIEPLLGRAFTIAGVHALLTAPLQHDDALIGMVACFFRHPRRFDAEAAPLAAALAGQAAQAVLALRLQRRLEHAAMHDEITGLPNRRLLEEKANGFARTTVGVLFLDLDGFKSVNDELGHEAGDAVLREVAHRLEHAVREGDLVARYGGDEFVVVFEAQSDRVAEEIAERLRGAVAAPFPALPETLAVTVSIGMAITPVSDVVPIHQLIRAADQAMYRAKGRGGDQIVAA